MNQRKEQQMLQKKNIVQSTVQNQDSKLKFDQKILSSHKYEQFLYCIQNSQSVNRATLSDESCSKWTQEQLENVIQLYLKHGSSWTYIASKLKNKTQKQVKNKYNNSLRRVAKVLNKLERKAYKNSKRTITEKLLKTMIDFVNLLERSIKDYSLTPNQDSKFLIFRNNILRYSLTTQNHQEESQLIEFIRLIKGLNCKIKCYGIFKNPSQKKILKIQLKAIISISQFDKITNQEKSDLIMKLEALNKKKEQKKIDQSFTHLNYDQRSQIDISLIQIQSYKNINLKEQADLQRQYYDILGQEDRYVDEKHFFFL